MKVVKFHQSAFTRQIHEAVRIQSCRESDYLLNSKAEFDRCAMPRLSVKVGYKDPKETSKELFEERRRDKQEGKKRAPQRSGNPKKKLKYETKNNETLGIEKKGGNSALTFTTQQ